MYRAISWLRITCRNTETLVIHNSAEPYFRMTAGPISHSPLPIAIPSPMTPGPTVRSALVKVKGGGAGSSATPHGGSAPWLSVGTPPVRISVAISTFDDGTIDRGDRRASRECHREPKLIAQQTQDSAHARLAGCGETPQIWPSDQYRPRPERQCLEYVGAASYPAVHQYVDAAGDSIDHFRECDDGRGHAIELAAAMIRDDDAVHPRIDREPRILFGQHPFHQDG